MTRMRILHGCQACLGADGGRCPDCREREALAQLMDIAVLAGSVGDVATDARTLAIVEGHLARQRELARLRDVSARQPRLMEEKASDG